MINSSVLHESPVWALAPCGKDVVAKCFYGASLGANDLIHFEESLYTRMSIDYKFDSKVDSTSSENIITIKLENGSHSREIKSNTHEKLFNTVNMSSNFGISENRSMFWNDSYRSILRDLYTINSVSSELLTSMTSSSNRVGVVTKGTKGNTYEDAFVIQAVINNDFSVSIHDKTIIDSIASLLHIEDIDLSNENYIASYIATMLYRYIVSQVYIAREVKVRHISLSFTLKRNEGYTEQKRLNELFKHYIESGLLIPITYLQMIRWFRPTHDWKEYMVWPSIANPYVVDSIKYFLPRIDRISKSNLRTILRDRSYLISNKYLPETSLEIQKLCHYEYSLDMVFKELIVRSILSHDIPSRYPLFTRGQWIGTTGRSFNINTSKYHRIAKFGVENYTDVIDNVISKITMRSVFPPVYVKKMTRLSDKIPDIFSKMLE
jgi:hypothetical protein